MSDDQLEAYSRFVRACTDFDLDREACYAQHGENAPACALVEEVQAGVCALAWCPTKLKAYFDCELAAADGGGSGGGSGGGGGGGGGGGNACAAQADALSSCLDRSFDIVGADAPTQRASEACMPAMIALRNCGVERNCGPLSPTAEVRECASPLAALDACRGEFVANTEYRALLSCLTRHTTSRAHAAATLRNAEAADADVAAVPVVDGAAMSACEAEMRALRRVQFERNAALLHRVSSMDVTSVLNTVHELLESKKYAPFMNADGDFPQSD